MDFTYLYTSFDGRINRKRYWMGTLLLIAIVLVVTIVVLMLGLSIEGTAFRLFVFLMQLIVLYPSAALMVKRFQDRDRPAYFVAFILVPVILKSVTDLLGITGDPLDANALDYLLNLVIFVIGVWFFIELGCLRGTRGPNQYGPDPLGHAAEAMTSH